MTTVKKSNKKSVKKSELIKNEKVVKLFDSYLKKVQNNIVMTILSSVEESSGKNLSDYQKINIIKDILAQISASNEEWMDSQVGFGGLIEELVEQRT